MPVIIPQKLLPNHRAELHESGLTDATIRASRIYSETDPSKLSKILGWENYPRKNTPALVFPYVGADGRNGYARVKPDLPRQSGGKTVKYESPRGQPNQIFLPPGIAKTLSDSSQELLITEGEKKSLCITQHGFPCIGLVGVFGWKAKDRETLLPALDRIEWEDRPVYIGFDSDIVSNPDVQNAETRLAAQLAKRGAEVRLVRIPELADTNGAPTKQGLDDYVVAQVVEGVDPKKAIRSLLDAAEKPIPLNVECDSTNGNSLIHFISLTPPTLGEAAYHGFAGKFIRAVAPYTEATDAGILAHLLPAAGTMIGAGPHVWGGDKQPARVNTALVGQTSTGRKGTSRVPVNSMMQKVDYAFWEEQCVSGLSSGEGLIQKVSDARTRNEDGTWEITPVEKRLYVVESEFSKVLAQTRRDGNILSQILRETYDSGNLGVLTRNPLHAHNAHICVTGHITPDELKKRLSEVEMANGFGNRFLWFYVKSDKELPCADPIPDKLIAKFAKRFGSILRFAANQKRVKMDDDAASLWKEAYSDLRKDRPGFAGALTARGESIVLRLSLLYALLDESATILCEHIEAGLAVWKYSEESVQILFKEKSGSGLADTLYRLLGKGPMKTTEFHSHMNETGDHIRQALEQLEHNGQIRKTVIRQIGRGRPAEQWERVEREAV